ncbi:TolC family protein [Cyclobacterium qasimii]|uniref:Long-chain-fatty-acid--CoA ligase n=2 Tax=Cyclobacterium qasimii TaxID=1350429 RepID=S7WWN4_9BACT|nr:TolC family protein [Cyclobacterium qasimii]EPR68418.1 Long-chain-fatty-acid--CoA ligase [Cyclobacterium qasimii M12-11B]GEO23750.1 membrane protein [Cyclobacterium qasimii]
MNKRYLIVTVTLLFLIIFSGRAQQVVSYTLEDIIARAKNQSPAALNADTRRENNYWIYKLYQSDYNPQLNLEGTLPSYSQAFNSVEQPDGTIEFREVRQNYADLELGLRQVIGPTGGTISVNSSSSRFDNFLATGNENQTRWNGVPVNVRLIQPIFAYNRYKWDRKIEPKLYEESKREYVEEMEQISGRVTQMFFSFLVAQVNLDIATKNLLNSEAILQIEQGRYNIGTTYEDKLLQVELQVLEARQGVAQARLDMESSSLQLKSYIGLNESTALNLVLPSEIPDFQVRVEDAIEYAFQNRSDAIKFDRERLQAQAVVAQARGQRFQMNLNASYGYNKADLMWSDIYSNPNTQALVNLTINVPILDWGRNKARMSMAKANQKLTEFEIDQEIITFEQTIFTKVRNFIMLKDQLEISKTSDLVADKRYEISFRRYQSGNVTITDLGIAQQDKDTNRRRYVESLKDFWTAYYELRELTLYDFEAKELLYTPEMGFSED